MLVIIFIPVKLSIYDKEAADKFRGFFKLDLLGLIPSLDNSLYFCYNILVNKWWRLAEDIKMCKVYIDFLFEDEETGEQFFVELRADEGTDKELYEKACEIAQENFEAPVFVDVYDAEDAEKLGYDTY